MVLQEAVLQPADNQFLTFDDAVIIARQIEDFFNSPESDQLIFSLSERFHLGIQENFIVHVDEIEKNCKECMGCHAGSCILGCFITEPGKPQRVCLWDEAIEAVIGTKLLIHEYGHVIFEQVFTNNMPEEEAYLKSEEFAQFFENSFTISPGFCTNCSSTPLSEGPDLNPETHGMMHPNEMFDAFLAAVIAGVGFGIGAAALTILADQLMGPEEVRVVP